MIQKNGDKYVALINGGLYASGIIQGEGNLYIKGSGSFGSEPAYPGDWSKVPTLASEMAPSFDEGTWKKFIYPASLEQLPKVLFTFRTTQDCATQEGKWFESAWQRETPGLGDWSEKAADDGSYPYPGQDHYTGKNEYWTYVEQNVQSSGRPVARAAIRESAGQFRPTSWKNIKVNPSR